MPIDKPTLLLIASECGGIARKGGLGDVIRDLSRSLHASGVRVGVVLPGYQESGILGEKTASLKVRFGGKVHKTGLLYLERHGVPVFQIRNRTFFEKEYGSVYIDSEKLARGPFEDDARRFAFFSAAVTEALAAYEPFNEVELLHCHDWHTGVLLTLLRTDPRYRETARRMQSLFTIHNLDYQGSRPFIYGKEKELLSFQSWFPELYESLVGTPRFFDLRDPRATDPCFNPLKAGIRLADLVTTVSPTYAHEITLPDDPGNRFTGGCGLERDISLLARQGRLSGILNGIDYHALDPARLDPPISTEKRTRRSQKKAFKKAFLERIAGRPECGALYADPKGWLERPLVIFISRAVEQKAGILLEGEGQERVLLDKVLDRDISLIALSDGGLGERLAARMGGDNAVFINQFDPELATGLYAAGDILLLPSYFEPCGISQLIAMRFGCLPLVHDIGGLHDTVRDGQSGFAYKGRNLQEQKRNLLRTLDRALETKQNQPEVWQEMIGTAMRERFTWEDPTRIYRQLYSQLLGRPLGR